MSEIEHSIVRIFSKHSNDAIGVGFLVEETLVITAAHVIVSALRISEKDMEPPSEIVTLDFPLLQVDSPHSVLNAQVVVWLPRNDHGNSDIAVLKILSDKPDNTTIARLVTLSELSGSIFDTYGIPAHPNTGVWAKGIIRRTVDKGRIQVDGISDIGYFIEPGFSGACVYSSDVGGVLGMIVSADSDRNIRSAQMIPSQYLIDAIRGALPEYYSIGYTDPPSKQETLISNLLVVSHFSEVIYVAPAKHSSFKETLDAAIEHRLEFSEWLYKGGNILSFHSMEEDSWQVICDQGGIEAHDTDAWAYSDDIDKQKEFVWLLNKALETRIQDELKYDREKGYYYFRATPTLEKKSFPYFSLKKQTKRDVFVPYGKKANGQPSYYRHSAFKGYFIRYEKQWYLEITPTYHFTWDGYGLDQFYEERLTKIKQLEKNPAVVGQIIMWARYLSQSGDMFKPDYPFLKFSDLMKFDTHVGINDKVWLTTEVDSISEDPDIEDDNDFEELDV